MFSSLNYNKLPLVSAAGKVVSEYGDVTERLCAIIARHNLQSDFGVRLIHKHFNMYPNELAVFRTINVEGVCNAIVMGPMDSSDTASDLVGKNYLVDTITNALVPYEFTMGSALSLESYPSFAEEIVAELIKSGATHVLGLIANPQEVDKVGNYTEFELSRYRTTVMVPDTFLQVADGDTVIVTNWLAAPDALPEPGDSCTRTRTNHYGNCKATRSGKHYDMTKKAADHDESESAEIIGRDSPLGKVVAQVIALVA